MLIVRTAAVLYRAKEYHLIGRLLVIVCCIMVSNSTTFIHLFLADHRQNRIGLHMFIE